MLTYKEALALINTLFRRLSTSQPPTLCSWCRRRVPSHSSYLSRRRRAAWTIRQQRTCPTPSECTQRICQPTPVSTAPGQTPARSGAFNAGKRAPPLLARAAVLFAELLTMSAVRWRRLRGCQTPQSLRNPQHDVSLLCPRRHR